MTDEVLELKEDMILRSGVHFGTDHRKEFLKEVEKVVCEGAKHYNKAENSYSDIAKLWFVYLKRKLLPLMFVC